MSGNIADSLSLLHQTIFKDHEVAHAILEHPYDYATKVTPFAILAPAAMQMGMAIVGKYVAAYTPLTDGQYATLRFDEEGKVMVDASVSIVATGGFTKKAYFEGVISNIPTIFNVGFIAQEFLIYNDGTKTINYELGAAPLVNVNTMFGGEAMVEDYANAQIQLATFGAGETSAVRIFARG